jgi:ferritin
MNEKVLNALNEQIKHEFYSSYLYLSIVSYLENIPLDGFGKWFRKQAQEEHEHAMKIFDYILDRNMPVDLQAIDKPKTNFTSVQEVFEQALAHEQKVTKWIHILYDLALQEKDHATVIFLQWFITEQVEEEKNANDNLDQIKLIGDDRAALFVLDQNFGKMADS